MKYLANVNGITVNAFYSDETVKNLFIPLLKHLSAMHTEKQARILVMLAAPPGAGKSTLAGFLEYLSREMIPDKTLQAAGMDGFHRQQDYLQTHTVDVNGEVLPLKAIKGAPVTFDLDSLRKKITEVKQKQVCKWPAYDRLLHNPVEDAVKICSDIVLIEGNYLLLDMEGWSELSDFADYTISLRADEGMLRKRLIERRIATGVEKDAAVKFVDFSDMANVRLCLEKTKTADLELELSKDGISVRAADVLFEKPANAMQNGTY